MGVNECQHCDVYCLGLFRKLMRLKLDEFKIERNGNLTYLKLGNLTLLLLSEWTLKTKGY